MRKYLVLSASMAALLCLAAVVYAATNGRTVSTYKAKLTPSVERSML